MKTLRNTGGRPEIPLVEQSIKRITIRFTEEEYKTILKRRETVLSKDMSDFIRAVVLHKPLHTKEVLTTYQTDVLSQLMEIRDDILRIGVNINQSAKRINSTTDYRDLQRETTNLSGQMERMNSELTSLISQLTSANGSPDQ